jgi:hypothetical protein
MAGGSPMIKAISSMQGQTSSQGGAEYAPAPTRATYQPAFSSQQTAQPVIQAQPQQMMPQAPQGFQGLQGLMSQMMARYQNPYQMQMRAPMPQYRSPALDYRPDMSMAQQSLSRVAPSVAEQQRLQAIEDARIAAEEATRGYE